MAENKRKKKRKKNIDSHGVVHIKSTFNNTHVTFTDIKGNVLVWEKAGTFSQTSTLPLISVKVT